MIIFLCLSFGFITLFYAVKALSLAFKYKDTLERRVAAIYAIALGLISLTLFVSV